MNALCKAVFALTIALSMQMASALLLAPRTTVENAKEVYLARLISVEEIPEDLSKMRAYKERVVYLNNTTPLYVGAAAPYSAIRARALRENNYLRNRYYLVHRMGVARVEVLKIYRGDVKKIAAIEVIRLDAFIVESDVDFPFKAGDRWIVVISSEDSGQPQITINKSSRSIGHIKVSDDEVLSKFEEKYPASYWIESENENSEVHPYFR